MISPLTVSSLNNANQLIRYNNQLTVVEQCFANIAAIWNIGVLKPIWTYEIYTGILLICQNTAMRVYGARINIYCVLWSKTYSSPSSLVITSRWFATSRWGRLHMWDWSIEKYIWNQAGNNNIVSCDTPSWPHQLLLFIYLLERAYFNHLECSYNTVMV